MIKWPVRVIVGLAALIITAAGGGVAYLWYQGSQAVSRAETAGWFDPAPTDAPLSIFETTVAKLEFGEGWNRTGFPCRTVARMAEGLAGRPPGGIPVSQMLARDIQFAEGAERSIDSQFRLLSLSCLLESAHSDVELLRIWLRRHYFGYPDSLGAEAASRAIFSKPSSELSPREAAKLAALIRGPHLTKHPEKWDEWAQHIYEQTARYQWDRTMMTRIGDRT
ncbi:MAG: transglycosylase domain-containing protein [Hyphomonadaceae bacterium]